MGDVCLDECGHILGLVNIAGPTEGSVFSPTEACPSCPSGLVVQSKKTMSAHC